MSLTSLLSIPEIKQKFNETFPKPNVKLYGEIVAIPQTKNYSLIGTAFDYLARFYIKSQNPNAVDNKWVAETGLERLKLYSGKYAHEVDLDTNSIKLILNDEYKIDANNSMYKDLELFEKNFEEAKLNYKSYIKSGKITKELIKSTIHLAQLDFVYRSGRIVFSDVNNQDILDLENLIKVFKDKKPFSRNSTVYLNPTFGKASHKVGGADADLIINNTLIDIKTTKFLKFDQKMYNQIIGYYLLSKIGTINNTTEIKLKHIGIYFSRHGLLYTLPVSVIESKTDIKKFLIWFMEISLKYK